MKQRLLIWSLGILLPIFAVAAPDKLIQVSLEDGEVWFEIPDSLLGKKLVFGTTVVSSSEPRESSAGIHPSAFRTVVFQRADTSIALCALNDSYYVLDGDTGIADALLLNKRPTILALFHTESRGKESTSSRCKVTSFFKGDKSYLNPKDVKAYNGMTGYVTRDYDYSSDRSYIKGVNSFADNVSVDTELSYDVTRRLFAMMKIGTSEPFSAVVRSSFVLPPASTEAPFEADAKIGTGMTSLMEYSSVRQGAKKKYLATKWPADAADRSIVTFHVAADMPEALNVAIDKAAAIWNAGFARYGYSQAVKIVRGWNEDMNDIHYSTIRYIVTPAENIRSSVWCDPSTGHIFSASIYIDNDYYKKIQREALVMTGLWNGEAHRIPTPDDIVIRRMASSIAHQMGICLGFVPNLKGSAYVSVDSLRSPSYTARYGITNSIMDETSFNYVLQDGDPQDVRMTQDVLGRYDIFAIGWLYGAERKVPSADEYVYGKGEHNPLDPTCMADDLGDDAIKSSDYAIANLVATVRNLNDWLSDVDNDYTLRAAMTDFVGEMFLTYTSHVRANIGGVLYTDAQFGNNKYTFVPRSRQISSLRWLICQIDECQKIDNHELLANPDLNVSLAEYLKKELFGQIIKSVFDLPELNLDEDILTRGDAIKELSQFLWREALRGEPVEPVKRGMQISFVEKVCAGDMFGVMEECARTLKNASKKARCAEEKDHYGYLFTSIDKKLHANEK